MGTSVRAADLGVFVPADVVWNLTIAETPSTRGKPVSSFSLPTQSAEVKEALEEFQRLVKHEAWEKAFKALDTITTKTGSGYIDRSDGVLVPSRMLVRNLLGALPTAGKNAYRVFYDSQATALWEKAAGKNELPNLSQIVNNHLISSVGDRAADRLGDIYFEQGDLDQAITVWRSIITFCPESRIPKAQILIKLATGLARGGRWAEFRDVERMVRERHAGDGVELGGRRVAASEEIARLAVTGETSQPVTAEVLPADLQLPTENEPLWQFRYQSKVDPLNPQQAFVMTDPWGRPKAVDFPVAAAADGKRIYVNLFGYEMAFDLQTGKLLWRIGKLHELQRIQQNWQSQISPERYSLTVIGDRLWSVTRDPQQLNQNNGNQNMAAFALVVRNAATGKEVFSSRKSLSAWNILGAPYVVGDVAARDSLAKASTATVSDGTAIAPSINFESGFAGAAGQLSLNGSPAKIVGRNLQLTDGHPSQKSSAFFRTPVGVSAFHTEFRLLLTSPTADGMTFTIQGVAPTALGSPGSGLGYEGIAKSVAVKFDLHDNNGEGANSTGLCVKGESPNATNSVKLTGTGINLRSGHPLGLVIDYDGTTLVVTITDTVTQASATESYPVNIPALVDGKTAYVGFTAATGGLTADQNVLDWTYTATSLRKADLPIAGTVYVGASRTNQNRELSVLVLNASDGKLLRTMTIGTHQVDQSQVYYERVALPSFLANRDRLYIDTHAGALVSLQSQAGVFDWGVLYDSPPQSSGYNYNDYQAPKHHAGAPIQAAGLVFCKGMRSSRLLGVQPDGPSLVWDRPVSQTATIVGVDQDRLYMGGEELAAYNLQTQELAWSTKLPLSAAWSVPLVTQNRLFQFTSRGICEVDKATGALVQVFRGIDLDSFGGSLFITPQALITVSNLAITAYPLMAPSATHTN
jgi:hypothetical protein